MSKELKAFNRIMGTYGTTNSLEGTYDDFLAIKKALQHLESIENASSSEALNYMKSLFECWKNLAEKDDNLESKEIELEKYVFEENYDAIKQVLLKAQEQEKFIDIIKRKGMYISAKELNLMKTYDDYKNVINERKLQQQLMMHITPTLIDWDTLESTPFYTEKEFDIVKRSL